MSYISFYNLIAVTDALPVKWHNDKSLIMSASISDKPFNVHNELDLSFKGKNV